MLVNLFSNLLVAIGIAPDTPPNLGLSVSHPALKVLLGGMLSAILLPAYIRRVELQLVLLQCL